MPAAKRKVLLMGKARSGKTSMRSVIFQNYSANDTKRLGMTNDVEQSAVRFLGSLVLNLWDCGGQDVFLDNYLSAQRDTVFSNVAVLIYVFDITSNEWEKDLRYFEDNLKALREFSVDAGVWVLINKMDLADQEDPKRKKYTAWRDEILALNERISADEVDAGTCRCFPTSIWDETLYKAWSSVIHTLIPNITLITSHITFLRDLCVAAEAVLFETDTFLVIAKSGSPLDSDRSEFDAHEVARGVGVLDPKRFEKISDIIKGFRKTCQRTGEQFLGFETTFENCNVVLEPLSKNTFVLIVSIDPRVQTGMIQHIIHQSSLHIAEVGVDPIITRKCGLCRVSKNISYEVKGDDDDSVRAWDDVGMDVSQ